MPDQSPRVAIVTGGARGIGRACAHALAYEADVASFSRAQEVVDDVVDQWGRVDFLLNNAGKSMPKGLLEITEEEWDRTQAKELGPTIHINAICPGVIETEVGNTLTRSRGPELTKGICLGRLGTPQDVANLVAFLAGPSLPS